MTSPDLSSKQEKPFKVEKEHSKCIILSIKKRQRVSSQFTDQVKTEQAACKEVKQTDSSKSKKFKEPANKQHGTRAATKVIMSSQAPIDLKDKRTSKQAEKKEKKMSPH